MSESFLTKLRTSFGSTSISGSQILERVAETCKEMLKDRGCADIISTFGSGELVDKIAEVEPVFQSGPTPKIVVYFLEERVGVKPLRTILESCTDDQMIFVSLDGPTAYARKETQSLANEGRVQFFTYKELVVNITRNELVPKHEKSDVTHTKANIQDYPRILVSDAVVQYYNFRIGDVIRIRRTFGFSEPYYFFRVVVNS